MITEKNFKLVLEKIRSKDKDGNPVLYPYSTDDELSDIADSIIEAEYQRRKKSSLAAFTSDKKLYEVAEAQFSRNGMSGQDFLIKILKAEREKLKRENEKNKAVVVNKKNNKTKKTDNREKNDVAATIEIHVNVTSAEEELKQGKENSKEIEKHENQNHSIEDELELDKTNYLVTGTKKKEFKTFPKYIIDKIVKTKKGRIRKLKTKTGDVFVFNEEDYQRLKHYSSPYYERRLEDSVRIRREKQIAKEEALWELSTTVGDKYIKFSDVFIDNPDIDIKKAKKSIKEE